MPSGKREIVFKERQAAVIPDNRLDLPCGRCIGCRLEYSRQWACRCLNEASMHSRNSFVSLTYRDECLPDDGSLVKSHLQLFMKRLRKKYGSGIRFYGCGEYGETYGRPHYHVLLFNHDFSDKILFNTTPRGDRLYVSEELSRLWPVGHSLIGDVTFESAAYVARYVMKKYSNGDSAKVDEHYVNKENGVILDREFVLMSRGSKLLNTGGIGLSWYRKFEKDCFPSDFVVFRGKKMLPPRFYAARYELEHPELFRKVKGRRVARAIRGASDNGLDRLLVKEEVKLAQIRSLKREVE